jgi:hypothetical protein
MKHRFNRAFVLLFSAIESLHRFEISSLPAWLTIKNERRKSLLRKRQPVELGHSLTAHIFRDLRTQVFHLTTHAKIVIEHYTRESSALLLSILTVERSLICL